MTDVISRRVEELYKIKHECHGLVRRFLNENVEIGDFTYAYDVRIINWNEGSKVHIGKFCSIADGVKILTGGEHHTDWCTTYPFNVKLMGLCDNPEIHARTKGDVLIGNDVWIGMDAKILSGVRIGDGAVIGAGAVVTKNVRPYEIVGGVPAKRIRFRLCTDEIQTLMMLKWWDWSVEKIAEALPLLVSKNICDLEWFSINYDRRKQNDS